MPAIASSKQVIARSHRFLSLFNFRFALVVNVDTHTHTLATGKLILACEKKKELCSGC